MALAGRRRVVTIAVALLALGLGWLVTPHPVPLYDGVGFPDEPYRFVAPPTGYQRTPPPSRASGLASIEHGLNAYPFYVTTSEQGPQFSLLVPDHALLVGGPVPQVTFEATPLAPSGSPAGTTIDGNVYRLSATPASASAGAFVASAAELSLQLRATSARQPPPTMYYRPLGVRGWRGLSTRRVGSDIYSAVPPGPGDYAVAFATPGSGESGPGSTVVRLLVIIGAAVVVTTTSVLLVRQRRKAAHGQR